MSELAYCNKVFPDDFGWCNPYENKIKIKKESIFDRIRESKIKKIFEMFLPSKVTLSTLEQQFQELSLLWKKQTSHLSSINAIISHPAYLQIIGKGTNIVPIILSELQKEPDYWFWALSAITGENPIKSSERGNIEAMTVAWLNWGRENGLLLNE